MILTAGCQAKIGKASFPPKIWRIMKLTIALLMVFSLQVHAKSSDAQKITIVKKHVRLPEIFKSIENQTGYLFFYDKGLILDIKPIDVDIRDASLDQALHASLKDLPLTYSLVGRTVVIRRSEAAGIPISTVKSEPIMMMLAPPPVEIRGRVVDQQGNPLVGVSVTVKGTNQATTTDEQGYYSIEVPSENSGLIFSFVGYLPKEEMVGDRRSIDLTMNMNTQTLSSVVVMGYASQRKSDLTGSVATVKADDIKDLPATSVAGVLQGKASGVQVIASSGEPGATADIIIRGGGSVNGMPPLFVVDGVRMETDFNFNNQDIESIEILKDASAAAIYGAQAAGGVVLITTKRGAGINEKLKVDVSATYGIRRAIRLPTLLGTKEYFEAREAFGTNVSAWGNPDELPNTDWMKELFTTGRDQNYSVSLSGGTQKANYYISSGYFHQDGVRTYNSFERYSFRINSDFKLGKKVKAGETIYMNKNYSDPPGFGGNYWRSVPSMAVKNPDGSWGNAPVGGYYNGRNPIQQSAGTHGGTGRHSVDGSIYIDYRMIDWLSIRGTVGATIGTNINTIFNEAYVTGSDSGPATLNKDVTGKEDYTANIVLSFNRTYGKHEIKALAGYEMYRQDRNTLIASASEFATGVTESFYLNTNLLSQRVTGGINAQSRILSQFGRINYSFRNKYLASATVRRDGSDRFGPTKRWGVFPAFSAGWKISEESFFKEYRNTISSLQLRGSYGLLGNIGSIPQYLYQSSFGPQIITALGDNTRVQAYGRSLSLPNKDIQWEQIQTTDIGLDGSLFGNKLTLTLDWYKRSTKDMIYSVPVPPSAGYNGNPVFTNIGKLENTGFEVALNYRNKIGELTMNLGANASFNNNKIVFLAGGDDQAINAGVGGSYLSNSISRTVAGEPMSQFFGYSVEGIFATDHEVADRGIVQAGAGAGDLIYRDMDGNHEINDNDRTFIGNPWPKMIYGLNFSFNYKGFDLTIALQGAYKFDIYNASRHYSQYLAGDYNTTARVFDASFFHGNGLTDAPRLGYTDANGVYIRDPNANYTKISSYFVEDGSYIKVRELQVGWNFSNKLLSNLRIHSANIFVQGTNLWTITKYSGSDPEVLGEGIVSRGIDFNSRYPQTRTMSVGLRFDF